MVGSVVDSPVEGTALPASAESARLTSTPLWKQVWLTESASRALS